MPRLFVTLLTFVVRALRAALRSRSDLVLENVALRQQVGALKQKRSRPQLDAADRTLWVAMRRAWSGWAERLVIVKPETVVKWHRECFRRYWTELSRHKRGPGRPRVDREIRELIRRMALENDWGAPRIHGELEKLGFTVSEATVSRYMPRRPAKTDVLQRWLAFLRNHKEGIAAMDFFTVPTASLRILYCWFVIHHERRQILHFNATFNPSGAWVIQQLREAFPFDTAPHLLSQSLAESCRRTVDRRLPPRALRSRGRIQRAPRCSARSGLHRLFSRGPHASRPPQGHSISSARDTAAVADREGSRDASCRRTPPPVRVARSRLTREGSGWLCICGLPRGSKVLPWPAPVRLQHTRESPATSTVAE